jgi:hypothetical protein
LFHLFLPEVLPFLVFWFLVFFFYFWHLLPFRTLY